MKSMIIILLISLVGIGLICLGVFLFKGNLSEDKIVEIESEYFCLKEMKDVTTEKFAKYDEDIEYRMIATEEKKGNKTKIIQMKYYLTYIYKFHTLDAMNAFTIKDSLSPINEEYNEEELYIKLDFAESVGKICKVTIDDETIEVPDDPEKAINLLEQIGYHCEKNKNTN